MQLLHSCRPRPTWFKNAAQFTRALVDGPPAPKRETRRVPLAKDLGGISLESPKSTEIKRKGYTPRPKDVGESTQYIDQMLSIRLNRRLPVDARAGAGPDRPGPGPGPRRNQTDRRPQHQQQHQHQQRGGTLPLRPRGMGAGPGMRTGGVARQGGKPGGKPSPRPQRRGPRSLTPRSRDINAEPEVPIPPTPIPSRVYDLTNLPTLASPTSTPFTSGPEHKPSDVVQHVREKIGGDYSRWMSEQDLDAAGKDKVNPMAQARLALAFNSSIAPEERKKIIETAEMLLTRGKTVSVPAPTS